MGIKFSNNASSNITHALTAATTSISITPGTGDRFPSLVEGKDYFYATLAGNNGLEIVKVTKRVFDTMTVERAQDGTDALLFNQGDLFELRVVAADFEDTLSQVDSRLEDTIDQVTSIVEGSIEALDDSVVHKSGNETITGIKTFTESPVIKNAGPNFALMHTDIVKGTPPASTQYTTYSICDNGNVYASNKRLLSVSNRIDADGTVFANLQAYKFVSGSTENASVGAVYPLKGSPYGIAPTTPANSTDNQIVTADYLNVVDSGVVHKTGDETIAGDKTFKGAVNNARNAPYYDLTQTDIVCGENPSSRGYSGVRMYDKNGKLMAALYHHLETNGNNRLVMRVTPNVADGSISGAFDCLGMTITPDGTMYGTAPTTPAGSTGKQIVTADWLYNRGYGEKIPVLNTADANKLVTSGVYAVDSLSNGPGSGNWFVVVERTNVALRQIAYAIGVVGTINDGQIYTRNGKDEGGGTFGEWVQIITSKDTRLVIPGTVIAFAGNPSSAPSGYLLCNGAAVSRTTYASLFSVIGTTYGSGNGSTTFNLPDLTDRFIQGNSTAGTVKAAGLPNITAASGVYGANAKVSGAMYTAASDGDGFNPVGRSLNTFLDASRSSSIYGASATVQPPSVTMRYYIKY